MGSYFFLSCQTQFYPLTNFWDIKLILLSSSFFFPKKGCFEWESHFTKMKGNLVLRIQMGTKVEIWGRIMDLFVGKTWAGF